MSARLGAGRLLRDTLGLAVSAIGRLFPPAFVPALASAALVGFSREPARAGELPGVTAGMLWAGLVDLMLATLVSAVLCLIALDVLIGKRHALGDYLRQAGRQFLPLLVLGTLLSAAIGLGLALLVVPGLYAVARYAPYVPAIVFEDTGWRGIGRAEELTRGYRWPIAGAVLVFGLLLVALIVLLGGPAAAALAGLGPVATVLAEAALTALIYVLLAAFSAVLYLRLRALNEGATPAAIAAAIS